MAIQNYERSFQVVHVSIHSPNIRTWSFIQNYSTISIYVHGLSHSHSLSQYTYMVFHSKLRKIFPVVHGIEFKTTRRSAHSLFSYHVRLLLEVEEESYFFICPVTLFGPYCSSASLSSPLTVETSFPSTSLSRIPRAFHSYLKKDTHVRKEKVL